MPINNTTLNTEEIHEELENYQNTEQPAEKQTEKIKLPRIGSVAERMRSIDYNAPVIDNNIQEALQAGYGTSRYDTDYYVGKDIEQSRALEQSGLAKIASGVAKGGVTAAATAVNTTLGTIFGLGSALFELAADADGDGRGFMDTLDAGVNNWLSNQMVKLQNWSEEVFPNYRTEEERSEKYQREWYKHMGTANFIGDSLLKNFGFTVGAMVGGMAWSRALGAAMSKTLANNIMKGAVAASEGDAEVSALLREASAAVKAGTATEAQAAIARAAQAVERGTAAAVDYNAIKDNILAAGRGINKMKAQLQLYGAAIGAMGEGTVEGIMAKNEFLEEYRATTNEQYRKEYEGLEQEILDTGNKRWVDYKVFQHPEFGLMTVPVLTEEGKKHLAERQEEITEQYQNLEQEAEDQADRLSSTTFLLNLPILTTSNLVQFGRMFSGGWQTARKNVVKGGVKNVAGELVGDFSGKGGNITAKSILGTLKVAGTEAFEEMAQGTVSSGTKAVADNRLTEFNDNGYDAESIYTVKDWFEGMYKGGKEYLSDVKNWQEGALGAITGLLGLPGKRWHGGVVGAVQDAKEEVNSSRLAAEKLNERVNSKDFQDRWRGYIRHMKYDNDMEKAVVNDDEYAWHTADDDQLASDVIMFADAGRLDDLKQIADYYGNITESNAKEIRDVMQNENSDSDDWTRNKEDKDLVASVKKQADRLKTEIQDYAELYDALKARAPMDASDDFVKEMLFTAMHLKNMDRRFLNTFGEVLNGIEPVLLAMSAVTENGEARKTEESIDRYKNLRDSYERLIAGSVLPFKLPGNVRGAFNTALDQIDELTAAEDKDLNKKVKDLRKMSDDRKEYFLKLQTMKDNKIQPDGKTAQKDFEDKKISTDKVADEAEKAYAKEVTKDLNTVSDIKREYLSKTARDAAEFFETIRSGADSQPAVKAFVDLKNRFDSFKSYIQGHPVPNIPQNMITGLVNDIFRNAKTEKELTDLPDNIFTSREQFNMDHTSPLFGAPAADAYDLAKAAIRKAMSDYLGTESDTASRSNVKASHQQAQTSPAEVSSPSGYDASQPGSVSTEPKVGDVGVKNEKPEEQVTVAAVPQITQQPAEIITDAPTTEQLVTEVIDAGADELKAEDAVPEQYSKESEHSKNKIAYYRTSVPEISTEQANTLRDAIKLANVEKIQKADLSDFVNDHPEYADIWNALNDRKAFESVVTQLETGDEIEFIVDPSFPTYDGQYQILMTTVKNGERIVLSVLSGQTSKYYKLNDLRSAIDKEYQQFINNNPNQTFVFSKKSRVWRKMSGLMDYDYANDADIVNTRGYDKDAPVIFINRQGEPVVISGKNPGRGKFGKLSDVSKNLDINGGGKNGRVGNMYYMVKTDRGRYYPIRLGVEHFKQDNKDAVNPIFTRIRERLSNIVNLTMAATEENVSEQRASLRKELAGLVKDLDLHDVYFDIDNYTNIGPALKIITNYRSQEQKEKDKAAGIDESYFVKEETYFRRNDQITSEWLENFIAKLDKPIQTRLNENGSSITNLQELLENGMITSNARVLRPKGADFYIYPWTGSGFTPITSDEIRFSEELGERYGSDDATADNLYSDVVSSDMFMDTDVQVDEIFDTDEISEVETITNENQVIDIINTPFRDLPVNMQERVIRAKYSEEEFDALPDASKEKILNCVPV